MRMREMIWMADLVLKLSGSEVEWKWISFLMESLIEAKCECEYVRMGDTFKGQRIICEEREETTISKNDPQNQFNSLL